MTTQRTIEQPVIVQGDMTPETAEEIRQKIAALARLTGEPITHARVRLTRHANPAVPHRMIAQANLEVNGRMTRAQVAADTAREAVDLLTDRLRQRLTRLARDWQARRASHPLPRPDRWRHGQPTVPRPDYFPRPVEERQLVLHKTYGPTYATPD